MGSIFDDKKAKRLHTEVQKLMSKEKANLKNQHEQKRLKENPQVNLNNKYSNMVYSGPAYVGSNQQKQELIYDTGSDWIVVESAACRSCFGDNFNSTTSTSWEAHEETRETELMYGSAYIEGVTGTDDVCLDSEQVYCVNKQEMFLIDWQMGIPPDVDGILGLSMGGAFNLTHFGADHDESEEFVEDFEYAPLFVDGLSNAEKITQKTFSFYLADESEDSYVDFGPPRTTGMSNQDDLVYLSLDEHFFWLGQWQGVRFGSEDANAYSFEAKPVIYDTGSSIILVGADEADGFFAHLIEGQEHVAEIWDGIIITTCDSTVWPEIFFLTGDNYWVSVLPEDYVVKSPETPDEDNICYLNIIPSWDNFWLAGNNLLRGYYSVHDMENTRLGLVPHTTSGKAPLEAANSVPVQQLKAPFDTRGMIRNVVVFLASWAAWAYWIENKVEEVTYLGTVQSNKHVLSSNKSKPSVKKEDPEHLEKVLKELQAKLAVNNSMD